MRRSAISATPRARLPAASATRPACSDWRHDPRRPRRPRPNRGPPTARPAGAPGAAARSAGWPAQVPSGGAPDNARPGPVGGRRLAGPVPAGGRADPGPLAVPARTAGRQDPAARAGPRAQLGASRRAAALAFSPALLGLGVGAGRGPGQAGPPSRCSPCCGGPGRRQPDSAAAMPGTRTPPRCAPGRGAACTALWWRAATSSRNSSPGWRRTPDSCAATWSTTSAATT